jgi:hypothetical protein
VILLIMGCAGGAKPVANLAGNSEGMTLDQALKEAADRIDERIAAGSKIAPQSIDKKIKKAYS